MVEKDKKTTSEKEPDKNEIPLFTLPPSKEVVSSIAHSTSVPLSPIPPTLDNQEEVGPDSVVKATAMDALVIEMAEKNLEPELKEEEEVPENPVSSGLKKIGEALGLSSETSGTENADQEKSPISSGVQAIHKGLNDISQNDKQKTQDSEETQEEKKPKQKSGIASGLEKASKALGLSPKDASQNKKKVNEDGSKKEGPISSFINVMNEGLSGISKNSREKKEEANQEEKEETHQEEKPEKKGIISSAIQDISETLDISPNKDKEEGESEEDSSDLKKKP